MRTFHILPLGGGWMLSCEGSSFLLDHNTKLQAIKRCRELIGRGVGVLRIHSADGEIETELRIDVPNEDWEWPVEDPLRPEGNVSGPADSQCPGR